MLLLCFKGLNKIDAEERRTKLLEQITNYKHQGHTLGDGNLLPVKETTHMY